MIDSVLDELTAGQQRIAAAMRRRAGKNAPPGGEWSTAEVAAHLAASERECFEPRIKAIARGEGPHFGFYSNEGQSFSGIPLESSLAECPPASASSTWSRASRRRSWRSHARCLRRGHDRPLSADRGRPRP